MVNDLNVIPNNNLPNVNCGKCGRELFFSHEEGILYRTGGVTLDCSACGAKNYITNPICKDPPTVESDLGFYD